ncbi:MAG: urease accessory protein UreF [Nitrososphaera sp.]
MSTDFLSKLQLSDSFFPTGAYTMSNGLEALFKKKKIKERELQGIIQIFLERQIGPADCCALGSAYESAAKADLAGVLAADDALFSMKLVQEVRSASARSGSQLVRCVRAFSEDKILDGYAGAIKNGKATGVYPVAFAVACAALYIPKQEAGAMMLYSFCVSMAGAALRLGAIDHVAAQKMLHGLKPVIAKTAKENIGRPLGSMWQFAPALDILQMEHEQMDSKMFIT